MRMVAWGRPQTTPLAKHRGCSTRKHQGVEDILVRPLDVLRWLFLGSDPASVRLVDAPKLPPGIPPHELHVIIPPPPGAGAIGVGDLVVPDYVLTVYRDTVPSAQVRNEPRRGTVHFRAEPRGIVEESLVLDAQRGPVHVPSAGVPGHVCIVDALCYLAVSGADYVVGRDFGAGSLEPVYG